MILSDLGFSDFFERQREAFTSAGTPARVTRSSGELCDVRGETGDWRAHVPRRLRKDPQYSPVVGDWVLVDAEGPEPTLSHVFARRTRIVRRAAGAHIRIQVIAANVDIVFVVTGLDGDFNPRRLERYLAVVADSGARAVVLLTKAGNCADVEIKLASAESVAPGVPVHAIDVLAGVGSEALSQYVSDGRTVALVGSSGAGKSTLLNYLLGAQMMATGAVRTGDDRGRHTTTHRELFWLPRGGSIIDNPGMRELQLWVDGDGLEKAFAEVAVIARGCRFDDCTHKHEPDCAVTGAVERGELPADRVASYLDLQAEVESTNRRRSEHDRRTHDRKFQKHIRQAQRIKRGR